MAQADLIKAVGEQGQPNNTPLLPPEYFGANATHGPPNTKEFNKGRQHNACFACLQKFVKYDTHHLATKASLVKRIDPFLRVKGAALPGAAFWCAGPRSTPAPPSPTPAAEGAWAAGILLRRRPAKPQEGVESTWAPTSITSPAPAQRERGRFPKQPELRASAAEWLPPPAFLPLDFVPVATRSWAACDRTQGTPHRLRSCWRDGPSPGSWDSQAALNDAAATLATNRVFASVEDLTVALQTQLAALSVTPEFRPGNESIQTSSRASLVSW